MRLFRAIRLLIFLAVLVGGFLFYRLNRPYQGFEGEVILELPRGTSTNKMADILAEAGVVRSRWDFILARAFNRSRVLQAGEYRFRRPASPWEVVGRIARGDIHYRVLVVPEGRNMFEIAAAVAELGLFSAESFLEAARNPAIIQDLAPGAPSLEGYLFPDTYRLTRHTTAEQLCRQMTGKFRAVWRALNADAAVHETVTLASLVEKEARVAAERTTISAVFHNRLRLGMRLDCDPTVIYAALLEGRYRGTIYRSDLDRDHPYNTYRRTGLPPGAIANPGAAALRATLEPAPSNALFFVLRPDGSGAHEFSESYSAHERAVTRYRRGLIK
jgi:UPF0755 protein